jgi:hypothetical protein
VDRLIAVISGVNTTPALLMVHVDQQHRTMSARMQVGTRSAIRNDGRLRRRTIQGHVSRTLKTTSG